ncbi:MAG: prenyltransferase/squalene oxidase repeat-containing protein, partial [Kiritimatiellia bacterium]
AAKHPPRHPLPRALRRAVIPRVRAQLAWLQPEHGGYLDAAPLTAFVAMSLLACCGAGDPVAQRCLDFLRVGRRADGSWPIDTDLAIWLTTSAVTALAQADALGTVDAPALCAWIAARQYTTTHRFTGAAPGGWGWTFRAGSVPDVDDTSGALLALHTLGESHAAPAGLRWLTAMQNRDGGWPTFCRGWGRLPFDRSCPDITAHALLAFDRWHDRMAPGLRRRMDRALESGLNYLASAQGVDGSWRPLWFGNQLAPEQANPVYGTAHVVRALARLGPGRIKGRGAMARRGADWLLSAQNADGGWGGAAGVESSIEETALALSALDPAIQSAPFRRGIKWLLERTAGGTRFDPAPIGLYFSRLWYSERLYPVIFSIRALAAAQVCHGERNK